MKRFGIVVIAALSLFAARSVAQKDAAFTGKIMDSQCALLGGHVKMQKPGENEKDCTIRCVGMGGKYALFNADTKMRYQLDDQKQAERFAGAKVTVTGAYDAATKTIHVIKIKAAS